MDTWLRLFNASGTQLAYDDDGGSGHYSSLSYTFNNGGTYYLGVSGYGNSNYNALTGAGDTSGSTGSYYLTAAVSNNRRLIDHAISLGAIGNDVISSQVRTLSTTSDIHLYSFTVSAGQSVYFDIDREASSSLDSYIRLFNSSGTVLSVSDDCAGPGEASTRDSYLRYTFTTAGIYYLGVSSYGNSSYVINSTPTGSTSGSSAGMYTLYVGNSAVDDMDDQISEAVSISVGASLSGAISEGPDVDMYKITVSAGERLKFNVGLNTLSDSYLRLFNSSGTQLAYDDDSGTGRGSMLSYTFTTGGTYYVGISGYGNGSYNAVSGSGDRSSNHLGSYSLSVTREILDDSYENNNTRDAAASLGTLNAGGQITGLKMADAADWYRFRLGEGTGASGAISISFKHSDGDLDMVLYDSGNNRIGYSSSSGNSESISLANLNAGEYYLQVYGYNGARNPDYTLSYSTSTRPAPTEPSTDGTNYVVLFAGGYDARNNHARYYYNIKEMYETMISIGIEAENIYVLYADGTNSAQDQYIMQSSSSGYYVNSNMSYASSSHVLAATSSNLASVFNTLSATVTNEDHFFFYSFDHGTEVSNGEGLCCWNRRVITDQTFATYANRINAKYATYVMAQCFSGGMIEDITVGSNVFGCSASSADNPSTSGIRYDDPTFYAGFSKGIARGLALGINNTTQLFNYAVENDPYASRDLPQSRGGSFEIFQNVSTGARPDSLNIADGAESDDGNVFLNVDGSGSENMAPEISDVTVKAVEGSEKVAVHCGDTCFIDVDMADPDGDAITKVTYHLKSSSGDIVLLGVADTTSDFLWRISEDVIPGDYSICVSAEDSYGNLSEVYESDIVIKPVNTQPEVRNLEISSSSALADAIVRISGQVFDAEGDFVDNVKIYLDANQDDELMYPDECLGTAVPDADGNWSFTFTVDTNLESGIYNVFAVAVDEEYMEGKHSQVSLEVTSFFQGDIIAVSDNKNDVLRISSEPGADYFSIQVAGSSVNVISLLEESVHYGSNSKDGEISGFTKAVPQQIIAREDGVSDLFIARSSGTWGDDFQASHTGNGSWIGNNSCAALSGKNRISDIFEGKMDANALVLSDSANGDALFLEDLFSPAPGGGRERLAEIDEIFAGAGDDIVDLTSRQLTFSGESLKVHGGLGDDTIWAFAGDNILCGDAGNDELTGGSDSDIIAGGIGNDTMHGGGGEDIFTFCDNWGTDTVQQLADGSVTLWFADGDISCWKAETKTFSFDGNTVTVTGVDSDKINIYFGDDGSDTYDALAAAGAFEGASTAKIYDDKNEGIIVSLS